MRILVVEDEEKIAAFVRKGLQEQGFVVDTLSRGDEALLALISHPYDAAILDIFLPGRDGLSVLRAIRRHGVHLPVLLLTARGELYERVEGLESGADDYLPKPFAMEELVARLRALAPTHVW